MFSDEISTGGVLGVFLQSTTTSYVCQCVKHQRACTWTTRILIHVNNIVTFAKISMSIYNVRACVRACVSGDFGLKIVDDDDR